MKKRKMSALQKKYFGKRKKKRSVVNIARRGRRRRYYTRARSYVSRARGKGGAGTMKNVIDGVIVGVAQSAIPDIIPMQDPLIAVGVGWFRKNPTLTTLGGIQLGAQLGAMVGGGISGLKVGGTSQI